MSTWSFLSDVAGRSLVMSCVLGVGGEGRNAEQGQSALGHLPAPREDVCVFFGRNEILSCEEAGRRKRDIWISRTVFVCLWGCLWATAKGLVFSRTSSAFPHSVLCTGWKSVAVETQAQLWFYFHSFFFYFYDFLPTLHFILSRLVSSSFVAREAVSFSTACFFLEGGTLTKLSCVNCTSPPWRLFLGQHLSRICFEASFFPVAALLKLPSTWWRGEDWSDDSHPLSWSHKGNWEVPNSTDAFLASLQILRIFRVSIVSTKQVYYRTYRRLFLGFNFQTIVMLFTAEARSRL